MNTVALLLTQFVTRYHVGPPFLLGVGLTLSSLMRIVNFAHGALYMLGAFVGYSLSSCRQLLACLGGRPVLVGFSERRSNSPSCAGYTGAMPTLPDGDVRPRLGRRRGRPVDLGLRRTQGRRPPLLSGVIFLLDEPFPVYRLFLAATGIVVAVAIWQFSSGRGSGCLSAPPRRTPTWRVRSAWT